MQLFPDKVTLSGLVDSESQLDELIATIKKMPQVTTVTKGDIKVADKGNKKLFSLSFVFQSDTISPESTKDTPHKPGVIR